jgi:DNA-binding transcriptional LysR family regulator
MRAPNIDQIRKLWMLDLIIQSGSFKDAALRAGVSPSAVSQALKSLEYSVGIPLVIRNRGTIAPTPEALSILSVVRPAFAAFDQLASLGPAPPPKMSWLNFGTYESLAIDILPGLIQRMRDLMPHLRLELRISRTPNLLTMIRKGELCSALITEVDDLDRFYAREVCVDQLGFFIARKHPIAALEWGAVRLHGVGVLVPGSGGWPRYFSRFMKQLGGVLPTSSQKMTQKNLSLKGPRCFRIKAFCAIP